MQRHLELVIKTSGLCHAFLQILAFSLVDINRGGQIDIRHKEDDTYMQHQFQ